MGLLDFREKRVDQIVAIVGSGKLLDGSNTSIEFRDFLASVDTEDLVRYANECLEIKFDQRGYALQDVVNQVGRNLDFRVENGLYRGKSNHIGFDGLWTSQDQKTIVVEVKTTDTYQIDLDTIAKYREELIGSSKLIRDSSSILLVVGTEDTRNLEAQIRGSRYAWDIRLISVEALTKLLNLKETVEDSEFHRKVTGLLVPQEYTKVDGIIDLVFSTAKEVESISFIEVAEQESESTSIDGVVRADFHKECIERVQAFFGINLLKQSRTTYRTSDDKMAVSCAVSRKYPKSNRINYWFAFHPRQLAQLEKTHEAFAVFGCGSSENVFVLPLQELRGWLLNLWQTPQPDERTYWHISIDELGDRWILLQKSGFAPIDITTYKI